MFRFRFRYSAARGDLGPGTSLHILLNLLLLERQAGETLILYGVGFGRTTTPVPAGHAFSGAAVVPVLPQVTIGGVSATVTFTGIIEAGLYQLNVVVPNVPNGNQPLQAKIGGVTTPSNVVITIQ